MTAGAIGGLSVARGRSAIDDASGTRPWTHRHLLDVDGLAWVDLVRILRTAARMRPALEHPPATRQPVLRGRTVTLLFHEASTRTRVSFEVAAKALSADVVNVAVAASSVTKGESLVDTVRTLGALGTDLLVVRHAAAGAPWRVVDAWGGSVVNAGDGRHAHPTQALLDLFTIVERLAPEVLSGPDGGAAGGPALAGRKIAIVGDVLHSRVARSDLWSLTAAGADVWVAGPATLLRGFDAWARNGVAGTRRFNVTSDVAAALRDADVVMALRVQRERMDAGLLPSLAEYATRYGINQARLALAHADAIVMHPGPMNEGVEIAPDVAIDRRSVVLGQVSNGVAVRMAVLSLVAEANGWRPGAR
ncbi:MAG TPA: aspartate carbamoyltransferase catalytic subunit [Candidatus Limnocylindrales bacterium]|nr:aspartate carbamoyltransferase catalytic subunit [Candidatus Limnocylindrales bacterium]